MPYLSLLSVFFQLIFVVAVIVSLFVKQDDDAIDKKYKKSGFLVGYISHHPFIFCYLLITSIFNLIIMLPSNPFIFFGFLTYWGILILFLYSIYIMKIALGHKPSRRTVSRYIALGFATLFFLLIMEGISPSKLSLSFMLLIGYLAFICAFAPIYGIYRILRRVFYCIKFRTRKLSSNIMKRRSESLDLTTTEKNPTEIIKELESKLEELKKRL